MQPARHQQALHDTNVLGAEFGPINNQFFFLSCVADNAERF